MIYDWAPQGLAFPREKHRGCCADTHFSKALPSALISVAEFYSGWKLKGKGTNFAVFFREKVKMLAQVCPQTSMHDDRGS